MGILSTIDRLDKDLIELRELVVQDGEEQYLDYIDNARLKLADIRSRLDRDTTPPPIEGT